MRIRVGGRLGPSIQRCSRRVRGVRRGGDLGSDVLRIISEIPVDFLHERSVGRVLGFLLAVIKDDDIHRLLVTGLGA